MNESRLEARIARLEAQNRRMKRLGLAGLAAVGLMSFAAPAICDIVYAERFVLRDASDTKRVTFNAYATDTPTLSFHDGQGDVIGSVGLNPDGAFEFRVMDEGRAVPAAFVFDDQGGLRLAKATRAARTTGVPAKDLGDKGVN